MDADDEDDAKNDDVSDVENEEMTLTVRQMTQATLTVAQFRHIQVDESEIDEGGANDDYVGDVDCGTVHVDESVSKAMKVR